jgi:hypothetical protein
VCCVAVLFGAIKKHFIDKASFEQRAEGVSLVAIREDSVTNAKSLRQKHGVFGDLQESQDV